MRNGYKIALALLYLMQLTLMFRESLAQAYHLAMEKEGSRLAKVSETLGGFQLLWKRAIRPGFDPNQVLAARDQDDFGLLLFGMGATQNDNDEDGHPHEEKEDRERNRKWRLPGEYLIRNMLLDHLRFAIPDGASRPRTSTPMRLLVFAEKTA